MEKYVDKDGQLKENRRKEEQMPSWAYQLISDLRDIKTTLELKFLNYDELCRDVQLIKGKVEAHEGKIRTFEKAVFWFLASVGLILIGALMRSIGVM